MAKQLCTVNLGGDGGEILEKFKIISYQIYKPGSEYELFPSENQFLLHALRTDIMRYNEKEGSIERNM